jgi:hypothetical protein
MALQFPDNRYPGVNAHLNSYLQQPNGMWSSFHLNLVHRIARGLDSSLPHGFYTMCQHGMQLREPEFEHKNLIEKDKYFWCVDVVQMQEDLEINLITRIEIISPTSKYPASSHNFYVNQRQNFLELGFDLVEIDLIHEPITTDGKLKQSPIQNNDCLYSACTTITAFNETLYSKCQWAVDEPLPTINVPLHHFTMIRLNLNKAYNQAFISTRIFAWLVDYEKQPVNFNRYSVTDQQRINAILEQIRATPA